MLCNKKFKESNSWHIRTVQCNAQKDHKGSHTSQSDCCGDLYPCYVTYETCEFCKDNEGWCSICLHEHERSCAKKQIAKLKAKLKAKKKTNGTGPR